MWSNLFINTPLTAANMQAAIGRIQAQASEPISIQPDFAVLKAISAPLTYRC